MTLVLLLLRRALVTAVVIALSVGTAAYAPLIVSGGRTGAAPHADPVPPTHLTTLENR